MAKRGMGDISVAAAGNASAGILGGGLGILAASFVFATSQPTKASILIRSATNIGLGLLGGMLIPGTFGHGFAAGLGGLGAIGLVAVAVAPDQIPAFAGFSKALRGSTGAFGRRRTHRSNGTSGHTLAGTLLQ